MAQDTVSANEEGGASNAIEMIVVTATKREQSSQDIGGSLAVIGSETLDAYNAANGKDIVSLTSGVLVNDSFGSAASFVIRGIGQNDFQSNSSPSAAVYVDDVFQAYNISGSPQLFDLERVEILKGPQGTLYGRNASSGAVNFITRRPTEEFDGYAQVGYGNFNRIEAEAAVGGPVSETLLYRVSGRFLTHDGVLDNDSFDPETFPAGAGEAWAPEDWSGRAQLLWKATPATTILLSGHYAEQNGTPNQPIAIATGQDPDSAAVCPGRDGAPGADRSGCRAGFSPDSFGGGFGGGFPEILDEEFTVGVNFIRPLDNEFYGVTLDIDHEFDFATLTSISSYQGWDFFQEFDEDAALYQGLNIVYDRDFYQYSQELRLNGVNGPVDWLVGAFGSVDEFSEDQLVYCGERTGLLGSCQYIGAPGRVSPTSPSDRLQANSLNSVYDQKTTTVAVFTHNEIELTFSLSLVAGYRFTYEEREFEGTGTVIFNDGSTEITDQNGLGPAAGSREIENQKSSGQIGINWKADDTTLVYLSFSESFKSGGFDGAVASNAVQFLTPYDTETVRSYELGIKADPLDNLRINAAVYFTEYDSPQARIRADTALPGSGAVIPITLLSNLDEAEIYGFELEAVWVPVEGLTLSGTLSLLDSEIKQEGINAPVFDGNDLSFAPNVSATLAASYEASLGGGLIGIARANMKYVGDHFLRPENFAIDEESYTTVDAALAIASENGKWEVSVWSKNLGNKQYRVNAVGGFGNDVFYLGLPRTYGGQVTYRFN